MNNPFQQHGAFSWCELMTRDLPTARSFYAKLFGWTLVEETVAGTDYTVVKVGEREIGGMMSTDAPQVQGSPPPHWGVYVTVENVDATTKLAEEMGANILVQPTEIPNVGRFAIFKDPQGAVLSIISYS